MFAALTIVLPAILVVLEAAPVDVSASGSVETEGNIPKIFTFDHGNVGVNFLGYKASAGLGGLLTGNSEDGGLHAEAGTPFGQAAQAGLGGTVGGQGGSAGGLYAGATAGSGVSAIAGLEGASGGSGSYSNAHSGVSAGGVYKSKTKVKTFTNPALESEIHAYEKPAVFQKYVEISTGPKVVEKEVEVVKEVKPQKTYIERTVIPNYEEKTIFVPSYVEKTIKVPTVVEKKVRVPVAPTVIEKEVDVPPADIKFDTKVPAGPDFPVPVYTKTKTKLRRVHPHFRKHFFFGADGGIGGGYGGYGGGYGGNYGGSYGGGYGATGGYAPPHGELGVTYSKVFNANVARDALNVPIATLGAVSKLIGGLLGGGGSISINKSYGVGGGF